MTKRIIALALAALLSFAMLTACGDKTPAGTDPAATDPAVSGSTDANGGADETKGTLIIGGIGPLTGAAAVYGINVKNGAQIAVDEINAAGGVNGYKLELKFQDDEHDPEKSVNAYNKLMDEGMQVLMGTVTSAPCVAVAAVALEDNMFLLTPRVRQLSAWQTPTHSVSASATRTRASAPLTTLQNTSWQARSPSSTTYRTFTPTVFMRSSRQKQLPRALKS